ncbi:Terpene synthase 10 [Camellia lanceoleosa]|uniref:Terpene synthase 10 n=1 Tax=Camellia lanceoleosa TaxID=1840588 RepID=A0ACC0GAS7_9ERIC|nr:Terpene synthase 10 [Camellia lanceoleosa]
MLHVKHLISEAWKKLNEAKLVGSPFNPIFVEIMTNLPRVAKFMYLHRDGHGHDEVAESVKQDFGSIDILVHSLANGPEVLAFEAGRKHKIKVNTISAGPLIRRVAKAIGFIDMMID